MESDEMREQLREIERGEAAAWTSYPAGRWWRPPAFGVWATAFVLAQGYVADRSFLLLAFVLLPLGLIWWERRRRDVYPDHTMPPEMRRSSWVLAGVVVVVVVLTWPAYSLVAPWAGALVAGVATTVGTWAYGATYEADVERVRRRVG